METHEVGEGWGSRYSGVEKRWGPGGGSRPRDHKSGSAHGAIRVGERGIRRTLVCHLLKE